MFNMTLLQLLCLLSPWFGPASAHQIRYHEVVTASEGADALLTCALKSGQSIDRFDWKKYNGKEEKEVFFYDRGSYYGHGLQGQSEQFKDRVVFFQHELTSGKASIKIKNTRLEDNGTYTCVLFAPQRLEVNITLNVVGDLKIRNITGAAPLPHIDQIPAENGKVLLGCKAHGVPKPEVQWRDSTGEVLSDTAEHGVHPIVHKDGSGHFYVELHIKVTRSDTYICVVTQENIYHKINNTAKVRIQDFVAVSEGEDAVLPCSIKRQKITEGLEFSWSKDNKKVLFYDRGRVEENEQSLRLTVFQQELMSGNISIKILNTLKSDSGHYSCYFSNIQKAHVVLQVIDNSEGHIFLKVSGNIQIISLFVCIFLGNLDI